MLLLRTSLLTLFSMLVILTQVDNISVTTFRILLNSLCYNKQTKQEIKMKPDEQVGIIWNYVTNVNFLYVKTNI